YGKFKSHRRPCLRTSLGRWFLDSDRSQCPNCEWTAWPRSAAGERQSTRRMFQSSIATLLSAPDRIPRQMFLTSACDRSSGLCFSKDPTPAAGRREAPRWQDGPPATVIKLPARPDVVVTVAEGGDDFL